MILENGKSISNYTESDHQLAATATRTHGVLFYNNKSDIFTFGVYRTITGVFYLKIEKAINKKIEYRWPEEIKEMTFEGEDKMDRCIKCLCEKVFAIKHNEYREGPTPIKYRIVYEDEFVEKIEK